MLNTRIRLWLMAACALLAAAGPARADWPERPVKLIVAYPAGSTGDNVVRLLADDLRQRLGQPLVIENRAGAGGNIGSSAVAQAAPDGYTLLLGAANNFAVNQFLYKNMGFDPVKAFEPVIALVDVPAVLFIPASLPARTFQDFANHARAHAGQLNYGSPGTGTPPHLAAELINQAARLELRHVPYKGSPFTVTALLANEVQMILAGAGVGAPHVKTGRLRAVAVGAGSRLPEFPDAPTLAELGLGNIKASTWWGLAAPKGTPPEVVDKLNRAFQAALSNPRLQLQLRELGTVPMGGRAADMARLVAEDARYWERALAQLGTRIE